VPWADIKTNKTDYEMANQEWVIQKTVSIKKSFSGVTIPLEVKEVLVSVALKSQTSSLISLTAFLANE
jgi:hypothetical protein